MTGAGTSSDPFIITSQADLQAITEYDVRYYKLGTHITVDSSFTGIARGFGGDFNGDGYSIKGLKVPLFKTISGQPTSPCNIHDLEIDGNLTFNTTTSANSILGILTNQIGTLNESYNLNRLKITGSINLTTTYRYPRIGGMIGEYSPGESGNYLFMNDCMVNVSLNLTQNVSDGKPCIGGLIGNFGHQYAYLIVNRCYYTGSRSYSGQSSDYLRHDATGPRLNDLGVASCTNYYYNNTVFSTSLGSGVGKTVAQLQQQATFVNFDFNTVWKISAGANNGMPELRVIKTSAVIENRTLNSKVAPIFGRTNRTVRNHVTVKSYVGNIKSFAAPHYSNIIRVIKSTISPIIGRTNIGKGRTETVKSYIKPLNSKAQCLAQTRIVVVKSIMEDIVANVPTSWKAMATILSKLEPINGKADRHRSFTASRIIKSILKKIKTDVDIKIPRLGAKVDTTSPNVSIETNQGQVSTTIKYQKVIIRIGDE